MSILSVAVTGSARTHPDEARRPLGAEVLLGGQEGGERVGIEGRPGLELEGGHHLVTGAGVGHGVDGHPARPLEPGQDPLHRSGGEVLAVHPKPVAGAPGEVEDPLLVPVGQVARPVPAVPGALGLGLGVVVVALEPGRYVAAHELADALGGVHQPTVVVEDGPGPFLPGGGVDHGHVVAAGGAGRERQAGHRGTGISTMAFSLEPYPSNTGTPNRSVNASLSRADVSGPST